MAETFPTSRFYKMEITADAYTKVDVRNGTKLYASRRNYYQTPILE